MLTVDHLKKILDKHIKALTFGVEPQPLYEPIRYLMRLGGKRVRGLLTLLAYACYQEDIENAIKPALAVEVFHNFTLMHDDIMDKAPLRRGETTVHKKWNENTAILSGDAMFAKVYELLLEIEESKLKQVLYRFNQCAIEICEGQMKDMLFENYQEVDETAYLDMIRQKTAVLLGFSLELGAVIGDANETDCALFREYGIAMGMGFQLMDDLLDVYAEEATFGKQKGGDIIANKKTFLLIKALQTADKNMRDELKNWFKDKTADHKVKIEAVTGIYDKLQIKEITQLKIKETFSTGFSLLEKTSIPAEEKERLESFAEKLIRREK